MNVHPQQSTWVKNSISDIDGDVLNYRWTVISGSVRIHNTPPKRNVKMPAEIGPPMLS